MKSTKKIIILIVTVIFFSLLINSVNLHSCLTRVGMFTNSDNQQEIKPKSVNFWDLKGSPIYIDDSDPDYNWSEVEAENSWCTGTGTFNDPYIIENIIINGQGLGTCIEIKNSDVYFIIRNSTFYNSGKYLDRDAGIKLDAVTNGKIFNNSIFFNGNGLLLQRASSNNTVSGNSVNNNSGVGIKLIFSEENIITRNLVIHNSDGISLSSSGSLSNSSRSIISQNIVYNNFGNGLDLKTCPFVIVSRNRIYNNTNTGLLIDNSFGSNIIDNSVSYNKITGIVLKNSFDSTISRNEANYNNFGIYIEARGTTEISRNNVSYNNYGVYLLASRENNIDGNNVYNNSIIGINLKNSILNNIFENRIYNNEIGINLEAQRNTIKNNTINNNVIGIRISHAKCNKILDNIFSGNTKKKHGTQAECNPFPIGIVIATIVIIILMSIIAGIAVFKRKSSKEDISSKKRLSFQELINLQEPESGASLERGQRFCVVHRGKIIGSSYLCPTCETYYCMKCANVLKSRNENCWVCNNPIEF